MYIYITIMKLCYVLFCYYELFWYFTIYHYFCIHNEREYEKYYFNIILKLL